MFTIFIEYPATITFHLFAETSLWLASRKKLAQIQKEAKN